MNTLVVEHEDECEGRDEKPQEELEKPNPLIWRNDGLLPESIVRLRADGWTSSVFR